MAEFASGVGLFYFVFILLIPTYFIFKYIFISLSKNIVLKVKIIHGHGIPKGVMKFISWYTDHKKGLLKVGDDNLIADFFLKVGVVLIWIAGEALLLIIRFYLWLNRIIFGKDPEWW